ncbi:MAG: aminotransferase class I/II-fold pyridoxal phosphate-dependent enzyme [Peptostreptococcales bacterium]
MSSSIYDYLIHHQDEKAISFHIPGHKSSAIYEDFGYGALLQNILDYDITEIHGADNLFDAQGIIKIAQDKYAKLLGVQESFFLVNGTSGGILAAILSTVKKGNKLIISRDCHKSVFNALYLGDIQPVFLYPSLLDDLGIASGYSVESLEKVILANPDADAVFIQNPNFYGIASDLTSIEKLVHSHGMILIVDEAHGAHLGFSDLLPLSAAQAKADIILQSVHKTLPALTQSSILHVNSSKVDLDKLKYHLQVFQSSSPSYLLLASLDIARDILERSGPAFIENLVRSLDVFYEEISKLSIIRILDPSSVFDFDKTKLNLYTYPNILSGYELDILLRDEYRIYTELAGLNHVLAVTSIATSKHDLDYLLSALRNMDSLLCKTSVTGKPAQVLPPILQMEPIRRTTITGALSSEKKRVDIRQAAGSVCTDMIIPYPPGIPLLCPGEEVTPEIVDYLETLIQANLKIIGITDRKISVKV